MRIRWSSPVNWIQNIQEEPVLSGCIISGKKCETNTIGMNLIKETARGRKNLVIARIENCCSLAEIHCVAIGWIWSELIIRYEFQRGNLFYSLIKNFIRYKRTAKIQVWDQISGILICWSGIFILNEIMKPRIPWQIKTSNFYYRNFWSLQPSKLRSVKH